MAENKRKIIFDFDGVVVDTFDLLRGLTREIDGMILEPEEYKQLFDGHLYDYDKREKFKSFDVRELKERFMVGYREGLAQLPLVPGIDAVIMNLAGQADLHIVTNGHQDIITDFLGDRGIRHYFGQVLGYQTSESKLKKFEMLGISGESSKNHLFVTDTLGDLREAAKISLPSIGVTWGFHDETRLKNGNSLAIATTPDELLKFALGF
jgi:phosphoglycolate phosphatase-like HAD superfamily hydrolase